MDDRSRSEAARIAGVTLQIVRDRVYASMQADLRGWRHARPGQGLDPEQCTVRSVGRTGRGWADLCGPRRGALGACRSGEWIGDEFGLSVTRFTLRRELPAMGYRKLSARPREV